MGIHASVKTANRADTIRTRDTITAARRSSISGGYRDDSTSAVGSPNWIHSDHR